MLTHGCGNNFNPVSTCTGPTLVILSKIPIILIIVILSFMIYTILVVFGLI